MHFIPFWERYSIYVLEIFFSCTYTSSRVIKKWFLTSGLSSTSFLWNHHSLLLKYSSFLLQSYVLSNISKVATQVRILEISNICKMEIQVRIISNVSRWRLRFNIRWFQMFLKWRLRLDSGWKRFCFRPVSNRGPSVC